MKTNKEEWEELFDEVFGELEQMSSQWPLKNRLERKPVPPPRPLPKKIEFNAKDVEFLASVGMRP
jgi:hypothetical protein